MIRDIATHPLPREGKRLAAPTPRHRGDDQDEIAALRQSVHCSVILEREGWRIDPVESTRHALKYRRGSGEILIVNHDDRGWWNPLGVEKGDCFTLIQFLHPEMNFGHVRKELRAIAGVSPSYPVAPAPARVTGNPDIPPLVRWQAKPTLTPATKAWHYLAERRRIPAAILHMASAQDCVRAGGFGSAWFAHRDHRGDLTCIEARGPNFRGVLRGGHKTLFRFAPGQFAGSFQRVAVTEAPIDALSLAAIENGRPDTIYVGTTGGMGPGTVEALQLLATDVAAVGGHVVIATDADQPGDRHATRIGDALASIGVSIERLRPTGHANDWNDVLRSGRRTP